MTTQIVELIAKSERALKSAQRQVEEGDYDFAVSRTYYAIFYLAEAALMTKNLTTSKHSGVIALFNEHFVKTGILEKRLSRILGDAFDLRQRGDYWSDSEVTRDVAQGLLKEAELFARLVREKVLQEALGG